METLSNARVEDDFAGIVISYSKTLAPPVDFLLEFINSSTRVSTQGRLSCRFCFIVSLSLLELRFDDGECTPEVINFNKKPNSELRTPGTQELGSFEGL